MALMPYHVAGAAVAAGASYQGYLQALPRLVVVVDPTGMRSFARRAAWVLNWSSDKEADATKGQPPAAGQSAPAPKGGADAWAEPERLLQSEVHLGVPYTAALADVNYINTTRRQIVPDRTSTLLNSMRKLLPQEQGQDLLQRIATF